MRPRFLLAAFVLPALLLAACGGGGGDDDPTPTPSGPALSDEDYVRGLCTSINEWVAVALSKTEDEMRTAVDKFVAETKALNPPEDAWDFQNEFVKYLEDRRENPTLLLTDAPPQPAGEVRTRLASVERTIPECQTPLFARESPSPTPGG